MRLHDTLPLRQPPSAPQHRSAPVRSGRVPRSVRRYVVPLVVSFGLGGLSLLVLPRAIAYDPWSWLIWGREIARLALDTKGSATSVKPLPMMATTVLSVFGSAAPLVWLAVARGGAIMGLLLAYRVGARLGGPVAGGFALIALLTSFQFASYLVLQGMAGPIGATFALGAAEAHLERRRRAALVCLIGLNLERIEVWPLVCAYGLWCVLCPGGEDSAQGGWRPVHLWARLRAASWRAKVGLVVLAVGVPAAWFLPDLWGAGDLLRSAQAATHESQGGPLLHPIPGLAVLAEAGGVFLVPFTAAFVWRWAADMVALAKRRFTPTWWLGSCAVGWLLVEASMAQLRVDTGAPRYLLPGGTSVACVVAGYALADAGRAVRSRWARARWTVPALTAACAVVLTGMAVESVPDRLPTKIRAAYQAQLATDELAPFLRRTGGPARVVACGGTVATAPFQVPLVAWSLNVPAGSVEDEPGPTGTIFALNGQPAVPAAYRDAYRVAGTIGGRGERWVELTTCPQSPR